MSNMSWDFVPLTSPIGAHCVECYESSNRRLCRYHAGWRTGNEVPNVEIERFEKAVDMSMLEPRPDFDREIPGHQEWAEGWVAALCVLKHRVAGDMRHPADYLLPGGRAPRGDG